MSSSNKYSPEVRERAVRMALEHQSAHDSQWAAIGSIAEKIGCTSETLRKWVRQAERDQGRRPELTSAERERLKALFGPRNFVKGSFRVQYVMPGEDTADAVTVTYFSERTWTPDEIVAALPDSATESADKPATVELFGCTSGTQAMREGRYMAAANRYRGRIVTFGTALGGLIPTYGNLIAITHDLPR